MNPRFSRLEPACSVWHCNPGAPSLLPKSAFDSSSIDSFKDGQGRSHFMYPIVSRYQSRDLFAEKNLLVSPIGNEKNMAS